MKITEIITFAVNTFSRIKDYILDFFGKSEDAYNEYDLSLTVTDHHNGDEFEPTGKKTYNSKIKVYLGNVVTAALALFSALTVIKAIKSLFNR